jgi:hypothetical protein
MGAAAAIFVPSELGHRVQGYILETPYQDLETAVWDQTQLNLPRVISNITYVGLRVVGPIFISDLEEISPLKATARILSNVLVLILTGANDQLARPEEAQALYGDVTTDGRLVLLPGAGHGSLVGSPYRKAC